MIRQIYLKNEDENEVEGIPKSIAGSPVVTAVNLYPMEEFISVVARPEDVSSSNASLPGKNLMS
jgi:hypothetical protein